LIRWVSAIEFASTRVVILTTWIAAIEFGSTHVLILRTWFDGSEFAFTLAVILTARIAAIEFTYGALNMPLALRLDHEPDLKPPCRPDHGPPGYGYPLGRDGCLHSPSRAGRRLRRSSRG